MHNLIIWICNIDSSFNNSNTEYVCIAVITFKSDCSIDVLNVIYLLGLYLFSVLLDWSWIYIHFLVTTLVILPDVCVCVFTGYIPRSGGKPNDPFMAPKHLLPHR